MASTFGFELVASNRQMLYSLLSLLAQDLLKWRGSNSAEMERVHSHYVKHVDVFFFVLSTEVNTKYSTVEVISQWTPTETSPGRFESVGRTCITRG